MDELIIQSLRPDAPVEAVAWARRWRDASPENEDRYQELVRIWALTSPGGEEGLATPPVAARAVAAAAEERRARESRAGRERPGGTRGRSSFRRRPAWIAAALAAGVAAVALGVGSGLFAPDAGPVAEFAAGPQGARTVTLDDGSFVKLAPGAGLRVLGGTEERRVELEGRAFFAVAHDEQRPFVVTAGGTETRVLGTRFEVAATERGLRTVVAAAERGDAQLPDRDFQMLRLVQVAAGSLARVEPGEVPTLETPADVYALLDWPGGLMLFQGTPLSRVAREVERRFGERVSVEGEALGALRISGTFEEEGFEEVVRALCETVGADCSLTADGAVLRP